MSLTADPPTDTAPEHTGPEDFSALKVVPARHPWRWVATSRINPPGLPATKS